MAGILQYCFLILIFGIPTHTCAAVVQNAKCVREEPCFDLHLLANMAERVSKDVTAADGEKILLKHRSFDKIGKRRNLHSCVLQKIIKLFHDVLDKTKGNYVPKDEEINHHLELIHVMDRLKNCLYEIPEKNMNPNQLAVLQLQKLKYASERLSNVDIQEMVMDELKSLHLYMRGKGFRKNTND
ncbi:Flap endonuclease 1 [Labeo rohita]|uniref:Flap endonuclease 1 n=1 Tax=Labeo rohita TaxID=84645 RepID=A0ABQ8MRK7_LABRO|nr:Flap endonuclease 1 [Labeo rohita]